MPLPLLMGQCALSQLSRPPPGAAGNALIATGTSPFAQWCGQTPPRCRHGLVSGNRAGKGCGHGALREQLRRADARIPDREHRLNGS